MGEVFLDAFIDSLKVFAVLFAISLIFSLFEDKIGKGIKLKGAVAPLVGTAVGLLPQCGFSVVATDLYQKRHITVGTLFGVCLATSDEAVPLFLANPSKALHILPILLAKFIIGVLVGYVADLICVKNRKAVKEHNADCTHAPEIHIGCCGHEIDSLEQEKTTELNDGNSVASENLHAANDAKETGNVSTEESGDSCKDERDKKKEKIKKGLKRYLLHPLVHSFKIFAYIFVINVIFGIIIYEVGEDALLNFVSENKYVAPLLAVIVGAIPNCASSVIISNLYLLGGLGFGATVGGLCMNAGLGFAVLFKNVKAWKENLAIFFAMFFISIAFGYIISAMFGFEPLIF